LCQSGNDIEGYAWFHGHLPRENAEELLKRNGSFLIRSSLTNPGEYVMSLRHNGAPLHFRISRFKEEKSRAYSSVKYRIEDESFDSIAALVMHHVGNSAPISEASGAIIRFPVNRKLPLSFSEHKYASLKRKPRQFITKTDSKLAHSNSMSSASLSSYSSSTSPEHVKRAAGSVLMSPFMSTDPDIIDAIVTPSTSNQKKKNIPPKPSRVPTFRSPNQPMVTHDVIVAKQQNYCNPSTRSNLNTMTSSLPIKSSGGSDRLTNAKRRSQFEPLCYKSHFLQGENKPMEETALATTIKILLETDPFKLARHQTRIDCEICKISEGGLEDIFLQKGRTLRQDLLERYQSIAFWVVVCIVREGCSLQQRVQILNIFIKVANELVHSLGNLFGFSAIMHGLCSSHLSSMTFLWTLLRKNYTNNSVTMDKKLRPLLLLLDEGKGQIAYRSTCIPHILPLLRYYENSLDYIPHLPNKENQYSYLSNSTSDEMSFTSDESQPEWYKNLPNDSFDSLMSNLNLASSIVRSNEIIQKNVNHKFKDFEQQEHLREIFSTEFHMRVLYGSKSVTMEPIERYQKLDRILDLLVQRVKSENDAG